MNYGSYYGYNLNRYVGQTASIFTTSGGQSGRGFTGAVASVNGNFVRLITQIGPGPGCSLGNSCNFNSRGQFYGYGLGSVVEVPIGRVSAFVHNVVESSW